MPFDDPPRPALPAAVVALWSFIFTDPAEPMQSCRVAAASRETATKLLEVAAGRALVSEAPTDAARRVIIQNMGTTRHAPGLISAIRRDGTVIRANGADH